VDLQDQVALERYFALRGDYLSTVRFVAKGCIQRADRDYTQAFSPVIRMASLRLFLAIAAAMDLDLYQLDIDAALLYAPITEDVYIRQPLGFSDGTRKVCHLIRCLYGLKHPPPRAHHVAPRLAC
jgi:hypothetical protein